MAKKITMFAIGAASALAGAYIANYYNNQALEKNAQLVQQKTEKLNATIAQLKAENTQLSLQLIDQQKTPLAAPNTTIKVPSPTSAGRSENSKQSTSLAQLKEKELLRTAEKFSNWLANSHKTTGSFDLHKEMQQRFDAENIDTNWAETQEQDYLTMFSQNPELAGIALRETQCRTRLCALTISIRDLDQANELMGKMSQTLKAQHKYPMIIATPDEQQGVTTLYIEREANSFEFN